MGSSSYISDANGEVTQHIEYFAFGETFLEEHSNTDRTPYLFNGKELDEETGLYYYGARYYDPKTSVWQSVDPLWEMYPSWSPYNYTLQNPINYTDPDGRYVKGEKTNSLSVFMKYFRQWEVEAAKHRKTFMGKWVTHTEELNTAKFRIFDTDFRATKQIINQVGGKAKFSYNKSFGKYLNVGLPLDVAHFFKMAHLANEYPDWFVRKVYISEEFNQAEDTRPAGRTSAFSPEDLFSNELGVIFGDAIGFGDNMGVELEAFFGEVKKLFTTNELTGGKYLKKRQIKRLRNIAEKYYGTTDLTTFQKDSDIYKLENIKKINDNASKKDYPFHKTDSEKQ